MRRSLLIGLCLALAVAVGLFMFGCGGPTVPNVVGMGQADAVRALEDAGYKLGEVSPAMTNSVEVGQVAEQRPAAGESADEGSPVSLSVSFSDGQRVVVPTVQNLSSTTAEGVAKTLGLQGILVERYSADAKKDTVFAQVPEAGAEVSLGAALVMVVSNGPEPKKVKVPDVGGKSESDAVSAIEKAGLDANVDKVYNSDVAKGKVIAQVPESGSSVSPGSEVEVVVSLGKGTGAVSVPSVKGKSEADAVSAIKSAGLTPKVISQYSADVAKGKVINQFPSSGSTAAKGAEMIVLVSKGAEPPATVAVPSVLGMTRADAETALTDAGFIATVQQVGSASATDTVVYQFPLPGSEAAAGAEVLVVIGSKAKPA